MAYILEVKISLDGSSYCAMVGEELQSGLAGFGDTPCYALKELINEMEYNSWSINGMTIY